MFWDAEFIAKFRRVLRDSAIHPRTPARNWSDYVCHFILDMTLVVVHYQPNPNISPPW